MTEEHHQNAQAQVRFSLSSDDEIFTFLSNLPTFTPETIHTSKINEHFLTIERPYPLEWKRANKKYTLQTNRNNMRKTIAKDRSMTWFDQKSNVAIKYRENPNTNYTYKLHVVAAEGTTARAIAK